MATSATPDRFVEALRAGEPRAVEARDRLLRNLAQQRTEYPLQPRQVDVLQRLAVGMSDGEIALELGVRDDTVKKLVLDAKRRLGARTRVHAVVLWLIKEAA